MQTLHINVLSSHSAFSFTFISLFQLMTNLGDYSTSPLLSFCEEWHCVFISSRLWLNIKMFESGSVSPKESDCSSVHLHIPAACFCLVVFKSFSDTKLQTPSE